MAEEKMFLSWNHFSETSAAAFGHFGTNKEFSDVRCEIEAFFFNLDL